MKSNIEKFVQSIPYGRPLSRAKIKVNDKGEIVIYGKEKVSHVQDLNSAIRQQLFHIPQNYKDVVLSLSDSIKHKGEIIHLEEIIEEIDSLMGKIYYFRNTEVIKAKINQFEQELKDAKNILTEKQKRDITIITKVAYRANKLLEERERCEKIITTSLLNLILVFSFLDNGKIEQIKWNDFFDSVKKFRTIYVNPYRIRTQSREVRFLQYDFYSLIKNDDIEKAKKKLWQAIEKIVPIYPGELQIQINGEIIIIQDGKITIQGRG
jgi:hypothetical protein